MKCFLYTCTVCKKAVFCGVNVVFCRDVCYFGEKQQKCEKKHKRLLKMLAKIVNALYNSYIYY